MKNFIIETSIIIRDVMAAMMLAGAIIAAIGAWVLLDVRL